MVDDVFGAEKGVAMGKSMYLCGSIKIEVKEMKKGDSAPKCNGYPHSLQLLVGIDDLEKVREIMAAIKMIKGVANVQKSSAMKSYERAMADVEAGRVVKCESLEEFKEMLNKP